MLSMFADARRLISSAILVVVGTWLPDGHVASDPNAKTVYLVAATPPQGDSPDSYIATLYSIGDNAKLHVIRQLFTADQHFRDLADDLQGTMYLAGDQGVIVIHQDDPTRQDFIPLEAFDDYLCWGAVDGEQLPSAVQYCAADKVVRVLGKVQGSEPRVSEGAWAAFKFLQYGGENGGPFQMQPPLAEIAGTKLVMPYSIRPEVVIAELPHEFDTPAQKRRTAVIVASTNRYLALWILPDYITGHSTGASNPDHAEPVQLLVFNRRELRWQEVEVSTAATRLTRPPVRIFGDWLVTTVMHWRSQPRESGEGENVVEHGRPPLPDPELPDATSEFLNRFSHLSVPGKLVLQNLADNRKLILDTRQEDSEILAVHTDEILYRSNDSIYAAKITGNQITSSTLLVKDVHVPQVHWAFWGPSAKSGNIPAANPRRSD